LTPAAKSNRHAVARALSFLLSARDSDGWWRDFQTLAGPSDEWVTAYTAWSISGIPGGEIAAREALDLLKWRWRDGFGYAAHVPVDCDSTTWFCRLAEKLNDTAGKEYRGSLDFLRSSVRSNGGVPTYPSAGPIREFTRLPQSAGFQGWNSTHTCVTAAAASLRGLKQLPQLRSFLQRVRMLDGGWSGYWWVSRAYPTLLAAEALGVGMSPWAERCSDLSSFGLACRLAMGAPVEAQVMSLQRANGSWQGSAQLRIPEPQVTRPAHGRCRITVDQNHIYTTATAIRALHEAG